MSRKLSNWQKKETIYEFMYHFREIIEIEKEREKSDTNPIDFF